MTGDEAGSARFDPEPPDRRACRGRTLPPSAFRRGGGFVGCTYFGRTHIGKPIEPWSVTMTVSEMKTFA